MKFALAAGMMAIALVSFGGNRQARAQQSFTSTATGEVLDVEGTARRGGRNTAAVKMFMKTGVDPYVEVLGCLPLGEQMFVEFCAGCHGRAGEGKIGPALNDATWIYSKNRTDKGIFETIFGGAKGLMEPHSQDLELDDMLRMIAWIRHIQKDDVKDAEWLTASQKKTFKPFDRDEWKNGGRLLAERQSCTVSGD